MKRRLRLIAAVRCFERRSNRVFLCHDFQGRANNEYISLELIEGLRFRKACRLEERLDNRSVSLAAYPVERLRPGCA